MKECFEATTPLEIPKLLEILKSHYDKIPSHLRGTFNVLKSDFYDQPNSFKLSEWKAQLLVLISDFEFEITEKEKSNVPPIQNIINITINNEGGKIGQINNGGSVDNRGTNFNL